MGSAIACAECPVRDRAVCAALEPAERDKLAAIGRQRTFQRGDTLLNGDDDTIVCATLISGAAKITTVDREGVERIVALIHPAGFAGQLFGVARDHHVTALTASQVCLFPRAAFEEAIATHPALTRRLLDRTLTELRESRALIDMIGRRQAIVRIAALLIAFARAAGPNPCDHAVQFELPLTRGDMAQLLGMTIETVSRNLVALEKRGMIRRVGARGIALADAARLQDLVA